MTEPRMRVVHRTSMWTEYVQWVSDGPPFDFYPISGRTQRMDAWHPWKESLRFLSPGVAALPTPNWIVEQILHRLDDHLYADEDEDPFRLLLEIARLARIDPIPPPVA